MVDRLEMIFQTQKPTWVDCKQLLFTFFNTEERMRVVTEAWKWLQTQAPAGILDTDRWAREAFPDEEPDWNLNSEDGRTGLERYRLAFLQGVRAGAKKPTTWLKSPRSSGSLTKVQQLSMRDYVRHTGSTPPLDLRPQKNQTMVNAAFVGQVQPDIRRKLQKLEGFAGKNATELLEIASKAFINQDRVARKEEEKRIQRRANIIAVVFRGYRVSKKKAQICQKEVKYLGFRITQGKRRLRTERKQAVCAIPVPSTRRQIREFLGAAGFCRIWIPRFSNLAKLLYKALKGEEKAPIDWGPKQENAFITIKAKLTHRGPSTRATRCDSGL
ncbi:hypothetical protein QTO34_019236 [Cnephaeus nilssonii]|uniref:Core shell protein Gag P30 domain-containing protein n=1 Tax=Cnephaeus nilssonii TaxID=3371016 RepID=A0AA40LNS0_CNENI|nr:hypothetical protein QTO34_019236 [Eptesicus nilssonii]